MPLHLYLPTEESETHVDRICALQIARNSLQNAVQAGDVVAAALVMVIDELIELRRERCL
jgi:hypothetical protein